MGRAFRDREAVDDLEWNLVIRKISAAQVTKKSIVRAADHNGIDLGNNTYSATADTYSVYYCESGKWLDEGIP
jgi:hypothetical protein